MHVEMIQIESPYSCKALRRVFKCLREGGVGLVNEETLGVGLGPIFAAVRNELGVELQTSFFMGNDAVGAARKALAEISGEQSNQEQPGGDEDSEDFVEIEKANPSVQETKNSFSIQKINVNRNEEYSFYFSGLMFSELPIHLNACKALVSRHPKRHKPPFATPKTPWLPSNEPQQRVMHNFELEV